MKTIAVVVPNALIVLTPETQREEALELIKKLDAPIAPSTQMEVFPLKFALAAQVLEHVNTMFPAAATDLAPAALAVADVRTNSLVVLANPRDLKKVQMMVEKLDRDESASVVKQRQFALQFAVADELATFLSRAIQAVISPPQQQTQQGQQQGGGQAAGGAQQAPQQLRDSKAVVLEFLSSDGNSERLIRSGLLSDVRVVAEPRTNTLLVSAPEQSMPLLAELIRILDVPSKTVSEYKVITLRNADAVAAVDLLTQLFASANQGGGQNNAVQGVQLEGAQDISSSLVPCSSRPMRARTASSPAAVPMPWNSWRRFCRNLIRRTR